jgi:cytochrome c peroxidase
VTNNVFDGPQANEDFGREDFSGDAGDRYAFRTSPLRNVAVQAALMHDGAFTRLESAIRHHLDVVASASSYDPAAQSLPPDLTGSIGPLEPVLARLDPLVATPKLLTGTQFDDLVAFVRDGLLDPRTTPQKLRKLVPHTVPSGRPPLTFEFGGQAAPDGARRTQKRPLVAAPRRFTATGNDRSSRRRTSGERARLQD